MVAGGGVGGAVWAVPFIFVFWNFNIIGLLILRMKVRVSTV